MKKINIATAIRNLATLKSNFSSWSSRLTTSNVYRETQAPSYSFDECRQNLSTLQKQIVELKSKITISNSKTMIKLNGPIPFLNLVDDTTASFTVTELINYASELKSMISTLDGLPSQSLHDFEGQEYTYQGSERVLVKYITKCSMTVRERDSELESLRNDFMTINLALEHSNHQTTINVHD